MFITKHMTDAQHKANVVDYNRKSTREIDYLILCTAKYETLSILINYWIYLTIIQLFLLLKTSVLSRRLVK